MWEIRERGKHDYRMGRREKSPIEDAYECGFEDGYEAAMQELEGHKDSSYRRYR